MIHVCYCCGGRGEGTQTDRQTDRQTDKQTDRDRNSQRQESETAISSKICRVCVRIIINKRSFEPFRCLNMQSHRQKDRQTDRQTDRTNKKNKNKNKASLSLMQTPLDISGTASAQTFMVHTENKKCITCVNLNDRVLSPRSPDRQKGGEVEGSE